MKKLSEHRRDDIFQTEFNFFCAHSKFFYAIKKFLHAIKFCLRLIKTFLYGSIFSLLINAAAGLQLCCHRPLLWKEAKSSKAASMLFVNPFN